MSSRGGESSRRFKGSCCRKNIYYYCVWLGILSAACLTTTGINGDYVCNNGTEFSCICKQQEGFLRGFYPHCKAFIKGRKLGVVEITGKESNGSLLYDDEKEAMFKGKLSRLIRTRSDNKYPRVTKDDIVLIKTGCAGDGKLSAEFVVVVTNRRDDSSSTVSTKKNQNQNAVGYLHTSNTMPSSDIISIIHENRRLVANEIPFARLISLKSKYIQIIPDEGDGKGDGDDNVLRPPYLRNKYEFYKQLILIGLIAVAVFLLFLYLFLIIRFRNLISPCCCKESYYEGPIKTKTIDTEEGPTDWEKERRKGRKGVKAEFGTPRGCPPDFV